MSDNRLMTLPEDWASLKVKGTVNLDGNPGSFVWRGYLREAFDVLDRDGDGVLNKDDLKHFFVDEYKLRWILKSENHREPDRFAHSSWKMLPEGPFSMARKREFFKLDENEDLSRAAFIQFLAEEEDMHILSNGPPPKKPAEELLQEAKRYWR